MKLDNRKSNNPNTATNLDLLLAEDHAPFLGLPLLWGSRPQVGVATVLRFQRTFHFDAPGDVEAMLGLTEALQTITSAARWISSRGLSVSGFGLTVSGEEAR